jgi:hypothetical protein
MKKIKSKYEQEPNMPRKPSKAIIRPYNLMNSNKLGLKNWILLTLMVFSTPLFSQPFITGDKIWTVASHHPLTLEFEKLTFYKFMGEKELDSKEYKILCSSSSYNGQYYSNRYFREENGIVYMYTSWTDDKESVFFNFNLKEGDIIYSPEDLLDQNNPHKVDSVITRDILGNNRKHWYFSVGERPYWNICIEGIGPIDDPLIPFGMSWAGVIQRLVCVHENDVLVYLNQEYKDCEGTLVSSPQTGEAPTKVKVFQRGSHELFIEPGQLAGGVIRFYTTDGRLHIEEKVPAGGKTIMQPAKGVLLYRYTAPSGKVQTGKIITK